MGKSADFSESIKIIQAAHADAKMVLDKWRDLINARGEIEFSVRNPDGSSATISLPTIREAIGRYLGGVFEQITLTDGSSTVTIRLDGNGNVELVGEDESPVNLIVANIAASSIVGNGGSLPITGNMSLPNAAISNAQIGSVSATNVQISGAVFSGTVAISGSATITGNARIRNGSIENLDVGLLTCGKHVVDWNTVGTVDNSICEADVTPAGLWNGEASVLEDAGIGRAPTWSDCIHVPEMFRSTSNQVNIYWGTPGDAVLLQEAATGSNLFSTMIMAMWPYKMYEAVDGGYKIYWLPLDGIQNMIFYVRSGDMTGGVGLSTPMLPIVVRDTNSASGRTVELASRMAVKSYGCRRFLADINTSGDTTSYVLCAM